MTNLPGGEARNVKKVGEEVMERIRHGAGEIVRRSINDYSFEATLRDGSKIERPATDAEFERFRAIKEPGGMGFIGPLVIGRGMGQRLGDIAQQGLAEYEATLPGQNEKLAA